jgi:phosphatidate cytidylyltransferase
MLKQRLVTAAVLIPLLLAAMFLLPPVWWQAILLVPLLIAAHEWAKLASFNHAREAIFMIVLVASIGALWWIVYPPGAPTRDSGALLRIALGLGVAFWLIVVPCWLWLRIVMRNRLLLGIFGIIVLLPTWLAFSELQRTPLLLLLLLAVVWIADTAAYFFGKQFGRRKLAPAISPGKTWEGVAGALATVAVYALALHFAGLTGRDGEFLVAAFFSMAVFSIIGDLYESWLKRSAGVKDSGTILPGHGGMLDRIDGVMAALPLAALIFA